MLGLRLFSVVFFLVPTVAVLTAQATPFEAGSEDCRAKPGPSAPPGSNWHYRVDRVSQRRCWFLSSNDPRVHTRPANSLSSRELSDTTAADSKQQSVVDREAAAEDAPRLEALALLRDQTDQEFAASASDASASQALAPHKVLTVSHAQPRAGRQSGGPGTDIDLIFLAGALATTLLIAGGAFQAVGQIQRILFNRNKIKEYCALFQGDVAQVPLNYAGGRAFWDATADTLIYVPGAGPTTVPQSREDNLAGLDLDGAPNLHIDRSHKLLLSLLR